MRNDTQNREELERAVAFLRELQEISPEGKRARIAAIRALSELAREHPAARSYLEKLLEHVKKQLPEECQTYRALFLEGETKPSTRQIARRLHMDVVSVNRHARRVCGAMLPLVFGIGGVFRTGPGAARGRPESTPGAGDG